jgi:hydrogenase maturation protease
LAGNRRWAISKTLRTGRPRSNIEIVFGETDGQNCFYLLNQEDFVFILDAYNKGTEPGSIHVFKLEEVISQTSYSFMQHDMSIIELMKLYDSKFKGYIIGIEIDDIGFGNKLSSVLNEKFEHICSEIERTIKQIILEEADYA